LREQLALQVHLALLAQLDQQQFLLLHKQHRHQVQLLDKRGITQLMD
jgi:hypothetical protein